MQFKKTPWKGPTVAGLTRSEMMLIGVAKEMMSAAGTDSVRLSDIKERLGISSPTLSEQVSGLEAQGYVVRAVDMEDRRSVRLSLTQKSEESFRAIQASFALKFKGLADWLGQGDGEELARLMGRVHEYFESAKDDAREDVQGAGPAVDPAREGEGRK